MCRICVVQDNNSHGETVISCKAFVSQGMDIVTFSQEVRRQQQTNLTLLFNQHPIQCLICPASKNCEGRNTIVASDICHSKLKDMI